MTGVEPARRVTMFRVLNGLEADEEPPAGMLLKVVVD